MNDTGVIAQLLGTLSSAVGSWSNSVTFSPSSVKSPQVLPDSQMFSCRPELQQSSCAQVIQKRKTPGMFSPVSLQPRAKTGARKTFTEHVHVHIFACISFAVELVEGRKGVTGFLFFVCTNVCSLK